MNEVVSVIVPMYNANKTIIKCLNSIIKQTYTNLEIIVIDDGSTDNSYQICKEFSEEDNRIFCFTKENGGVSAARNYGIEKSTGKWIVFVDADDDIDPELIWKLVENSKKDQLIGATMKIISQKKWICQYCKAEYTIDEFVKGLVEGTVLGVCLGYLFERKKVNSFNTKIGYMEDTLFLIEYITKHIKHVKFCEHNYNYWDNEEGITKTKNIYKIKKNLVDIDTALKLLDEYYKENYLKIYNRKVIAQREVKLFESEISKILSMKDIEILLQDSIIVNILKTISLKFIGLRYGVFILIMRTNSPKCMYMYIYLRRIIKKILKR